MMTPDFSKSPNGLLPVIVQDADTLSVLMLGYMNTEAYEKTMQEKRVTFFSRSKNRLWTKGETSGHLLEVVHVFCDCDQDTLLIKAKPAGPVCHTGTYTCFGETKPVANFLPRLEDIIRSRKEHPASGSYVSSLFAKGINKMAQKVGEEAVELVIEAKDQNQELFCNEAADLLFHYLILLQAKGLCLADISTVLEARHRN